MDQAEIVYKETKGFSPFAYTMVNKWLYFCDQNMPYLFRYHLEKKICECVAGFNDYHLGMQFFKMVFYGEELWLLPFRDNKIIRFNINKKNFLNYDVLKENIKLDIPFYDVIFYKEKAFIIPFSANPFLVKVDLVTYEMIKIELVGLNHKSENINFLGAVRFREKIYMLESINNLLVSYNIESGEIEVINSIEYNLKDTFPIKGIGNNIYFFPLDINRSVIIYNIDYSSFYEKEFPIKNFPSKEIYLVSVLDDNIWIFANKKAKIYLLDQEMEIKKEISVLNFNANDKTMYVSGMEFTDRFFWHGHARSPLIQVMNNHIEILDIYKNKKILEIYLQIINEDMKYKKEMNVTRVGEEIYKDIISIGK